MIAVADTSPICYLILIGEIDLLPKLFSQVLVPEAVLAELLHKDAPPAVRSWASKQPSSWQSPRWPALSCSTRKQRDVLPPLAACGSLGSWVFWARLPLGGCLSWHPQSTASG